MAVGAALPKTWPQLRVSSLLGWRPALPAAIKFPGNGRFYERADREGNDTVTTLVPPARGAEQSLGTSRETNRGSYGVPLIFLRRTRAIFPAAAIPTGKYCRRVLTRIFSTSKWWRINGGSVWGTWTIRHIHWILVFAAVRWASLLGSSFVEHHLLFVGW